MQLCTYTTEACMHRGIHTHNYEYTIHSAHANMCICKEACTHRSTNIHACAYTHFLKHRIGSCDYESGEVLKSVLVSGRLRRVGVCGVIFKVTGSVTPREPTFSVQGKRKGKINILAYATCRRNPLLSRPFSPI